jgi:Tat protein translocase TatB subunit
VFNVGGPEVLVILLLALIVLGPQRLPDAARQLGRARAELRKLSSGFQDELRTAFDTETETAARARGASAADPTAPPAAIEPNAVAASTAAAGPDQVANPPAPKARRRTAPLRAERSPTEPPAP